MYEPNAVELRTLSGRKTESEKRRQLLDLQTVVQIVAHMPISDGDVTDVKDGMTLKDLKGKTVDVQTLCVMQLARKAMDGDINAFTTFVKIGNMMPAEKQELEFITPVFAGALPEKDDNRTLTNEEVLERARLMEEKMSESDIVVEPSAITEED